MIGGLIPLLVLAAIGYGLFRLLSGRDDAASGQPIEGDAKEIVARLFRLGLLAIAVVLVAEGLASLIDQVLPRSDGELSRDPLVIAQALSFTIVGVPVVAGMGWWTARRLAADRLEHRSVIWAAYLGGVLTVAVIMMMITIHDVLSWMAGVESFNGRVLGQAMAWTAVGVVHWILNRRRPLVDRGGTPEPRTPFYLLVGSAIGLAGAGFGLWRLLRSAIRPLLDAGLGDVMVTDGSRAVRAAAITAVIGLAAWLWFWWFHGRTSPPDQRWYGYVLLVGVLSGLVTTVTGLAVLLHSCLQWFFGDPGSIGAAAHFDSAPDSAAAALVGAAIWLHHHSTLVPATSSAAIATPAETGIIDRIHDYLVTFAGLVVSAIGGALLLSAGVEASAGPAIATESIANPVVLAVTFLILGLPLWLRFWHRSQQRVLADRAEVRTMPRRVHLNASIGVAAATALISLVITLTIVFADAADQGIHGETLFRLRYPLGFLLSALAVGAYHLVIYRRDQLLSPDEARTAADVRPSHSDRGLMVVSDLSNDRHRALLTRLGRAGHPVTTVRIGGNGSAPDDATFTQAERDLDSLDADRVLVIVHDGRIEVAPILETTST